MGGVKEIFKRLFW